MPQQISVLCVGGTWEVGDPTNPLAPIGMCRGVTGRLDANRFRSRWVAYPARYAAGMSYKESRTTGEENLIAAIGRDWNPVVLLGYSQGADIVGNVAAAVARGEYPDLNVAGVALIADPARHPRQVLGPDPGGYGIRGQRFIPDGRFPVWQVAASGDPIAALPTGNPLRSIADLSEAFSTRPEDARPWLRDIGSKAALGRMQPWWAPWRWQDWAGAVAWARGYAIDGRHTVAYWSEGHLTRLATAIERGVR